MNDDDTEDEVPLTCHRHPGRERALPCRLCGKVVCYECRISHYAGTLPIPVCKQCDARLTRRRKLRKIGSGSGGLVLIVIVFGLLYMGPGRAGRGGPAGIGDEPPRIRDVKGVVARPLASARVALAPDGQPATVVAVELTSTDGKVPIRPSARDTSTRGPPPRSDQIPGLNPRVGFWSVSTLDDELPVARAWVAGPGDLKRLRRAATRADNGAGASPYQLPPLADRMARTPLLEPGGKPVRVLLVVTARDYDSDEPPKPGAIFWLRYHHFSSTARGRRFQAALKPTPKRPPEARAVRPEHRAATRSPG